MEVVPRMPEGEGTFVHPLRATLALIPIPVGCCYGRFLSPETELGLPSAGTGALQPHLRGATPARSSLGKGRQKRLPHLLARNIFHGNRARKMNAETPRRRGRNAEKIYSWFSPRLGGSALHSFLRKKKCAPLTYWQGIIPWVSGR